MRTAAADWAATRRLLLDSRPQVQSRASAEVATVAVEMAQAAVESAEAAQAEAEAEAEAERVAVAVAATEAVAATVAVVASAARRLAPPVGTLVVVAMVKGSEVGLVAGATVATAAAERMERRRSQHC